MLRVYATAAVYGLISFFGVTIAVAQSEFDFAELAKPVYQAIAEGNYAAAAAAGLVFAVALVRRYGGSRWPILSHKLVAPLLVLLASFGAALASATVAGASVSMAMVWAALKVAVLASGGYALLKPYMDKLESLAPSWLKPFVSLLAAVFSAKAGAKAAAKAAGDAAVLEKPAQGPDIGFKDVE